MSDVHATLHWLASLAPTRLTGTPEERAVQDAIAERLKPHGFDASVQPFRFPRHIYGSLALHFGLALCFVGVGLYVSWLGALGHLVVASSFYAEAVLRRHLLRRLWPPVATQNLILVKSARDTLRRRVVLLAHVDSAYTGLMFQPAVLRQIAKPPPFLPFLRKQLLLPFVCVLVLMGLEALQPFFAPPLVRAPRRTARRGAPRVLRRRGHLRRRDLRLRARTRRLGRAAAHLRSGRLRLPRARPRRV